MNQPNVNTPSSNGNGRTSWLKVAGQSNTTLEHLLIERLQSRFIPGKFGPKDVSYVSKLSRPLCPNGLELPTSRLEKLRTMCSLWDLKLHPAKITSHRPVIGPLIVAAKKVLYPILGMLLKETLKQQREFNAAAISLLAEVADERAVKERR